MHGVKEGDIHLSHNGLRWHETNGNKLMFHSCATDDTLPSPLGLSRKLCLHVHTRNASYDMEVADYVAAFLSFWWFECELVKTAKILYLRDLLEHIIMDSFFSKLFKSEATHC